MSKTQIMLKFFFYLVLALVIFVPIVLWGAKFFKVSIKESDDYYKLVEFVGSVKDEEVLSTPVYLEKKSL